MKKKISKILAVLLSVFVLFSSMPITALAALTEGSKYSYTEKYLDAYYSTGTWQTADGHTHNNSGQVALRNLKSTGEPLYCIQIYEGCTGADAMAVNIESTNLWDRELTQIAKNGITRVSIYGYDGSSVSTYGYHWSDAQLATQVLLWEFEMGKRGQFGYTDPSYFAEDIFRNYPNAKACYKKIVEACAKHQNRPSFSNQTVTLKGTGSGNSVTLTDSNNALSNFTVKSTNDRIHTSVSGNKLTVYASGEGTLNGRLIFTKKNTDINSAFALTGANQTLFYGKIADPVTAPLTIELSLGNCKIVKTSEDGQIANKEFNIKGNGVNKNVKTGSNGSFTVTDLQPGTYTVTEKVGNQYRAQSAKTVTVKAGETATVKFNNVLTKGKITIHKTGEAFSSVSYDENTGTYQPVYQNTDLPNAVYDIYANETIVSGSIKIAKNTLVDTIKTDSNGSKTSKELYLNANGKAEYRVVERTAPSNAYVLDTKSYTVTLTQKEAHKDATAKLELTNERKKVKIEFNKILELDELFNIGSNNEIQNVLFGLYAEKNITAADGKVIPADGLIETISVNPETINTFTAKSDLPKGSYYLQEIATDNHYILSDAKYPFTVSYTSDNSAQITATINDGNDIENTLKRARIEGIKYGDNGEVLADAVIGLFAEGTDEFTEDTALMTTVTDENGKFSFENIVVGSYIVKELVAPENYLLDPTAYEVEITENEQVVTLTITDVIKRGNIEGLKLGDRGEVLANAVIGLFAEGTEDFTEDTALMTTVTDENGKFSFENIVVGSYIVKELVAPKDYLLDLTAYEVEITENEQIVTLTITDVIKRGSIEGIKVDDKGNPLEDALIGLFTADTKEFTEDTAVMTVKSGKDGYFSFSDVIVGKYIVKELEAPEGYILDEKSYDVEITEDKQIVELTIVNTMKIGKLVLEYDYKTSPKTGADSTITIISLATAFIVTLTTVLVAKKRKQVQ